MRRSFFFIVATMLCATAVSAQKTQYNFGVKAGLNVATVSGKGVSSLSGVVGGVMLEGMRPGGISATGELLFSSQGYEFAGVKFKLNYIVLPLMVNWNAIDGLMFKAGLQPGLLVSDKRKGMVGANPGAFDDFYNKFDLSVPVGASYTSNAGFMVEFRYNIGITSVAKRGEQNGKNSVMSIMAGYKF